MLESNVEHDATKVKSIEYKGVVQTCNPLTTHDTLELSVLNSFSFFRVTGTGWWSGVGGQLNTRFRVPYLFTYGLYEFKTLSSKVSVQSLLTFTHFFTNLI